MKYDPIEVRIKDGWLEFYFIRGDNGEYHHTFYEIELSRLKNFEIVSRWIENLSRKMWFTSEIKNKVVSLTRVCSFDPFISNLLDEIEKKKETANAYQLKILNRIIAILEEYV